MSWYDYVLSFYVYEKQAYCVLGFVFFFFLVSLQDPKTITYFSGTNFQDCKLPKPRAILSDISTYFLANLVFISTSNRWWAQREREELIFLFVGDVNKRFDRRVH